MKHLPILAIVLFLISCSPQESPETTAIRNYIEQNTNNPKTYEPVQTIQADFPDLYLLPAVSGQLMNVENVLGRFCDLLESIDLKFQSLYDDSIRSRIFLILEQCCTYEHLETIMVSNRYIDNSESIVEVFTQLKDKIPSKDLQTFLEYTAQLEGTSKRLEIEVNRMFSIINKYIGLNGYSELAKAIDSGQVLLHKYRIDENGASVLKTALFRVIEGQAIAGVPVEVDNQL